MSQDLRYKYGVNQQGCWLGNIVVLFFLFFFSEEKLGETNLSRGENCRVEIFFLVLLRKTP